MKQRYVAALDQGTTSTRCMLFDSRGQMVALTQREHRQYYPRPGWVEHDAAQIWDIVSKIVPRTLADAGVSVDQVVGLGITNQRETTVVWDRYTGVPAHRAIVWQDVRTADLLPRVVEGIGAQVMQERTGLPLSTYSSGPKLRWLLEQDPSLRARAERGDLLFGTMDTWLVWNLTGGPDGGRHVTDATNASRTMLMDLDTLDWDGELLAAMRVPRAMLPQIAPTISTIGMTRSPVAGIPITAMIGDQQASLFGQTALEPGEAKCTFGTGSFLLLNTGTEAVRSRRGLITTVAYELEGQPPVYALEGAMAVAGALVKWCRDNLGLIRSVAEIETQALTVQDNGGCYIVPAFAGLFAPHWESEARGIIVGLTGYVTKAHICRAVLEATAWQTREVVEAMNQDAQVPLATIAVDGGMTANNLLMQIVADVLDVPIVRPMMAETVALGAAYAAGIGAGYWPDHQVLREYWQPAAEWLPAMDPNRRDAEWANWRRAVRSSIEWGHRD
ncbi:glycerol kinase GlpK [Dermatophilaceae bacterium Sec6.4]